MSSGAGLPSGPGPASVDWAEAWRRAREGAVRLGGSEAWDRRAPAFARGAARSGYVEWVLGLVAAQPHETVLDVGCGPGTVAVPLARRARAVTALDFSPRMLELLRARCAEERIENVTAVLGAWEDDWAERGLVQDDPRHDVALASRSLTTADLRGALEKLQRAAGRVVLTAPAGEMPLHRRVLEAVGRRYQPGPDFVYPLNLLRQLGVFPEVAILAAPDARRYASLEDAHEALRWVVRDATEPELARLRGWLERTLEPADGALVLPALEPMRWAALTWRSPR